ncbi:hypothetical protein [Lentiprolixibacter aurantiacus]|uniref:Uncharacterized protein n=1 Tax=Lentiprolixibacter aurantiacus TaxID=2993939 RepID=A0AAE3MLR4_9FLAO|nr:hypothetical protein [Lentiprolixibacter aurantiacus]MCX2719763.1 hypothetical protein [Lentiprolixibacter aurantiacus]
MIARAIDGKNIVNDVATGLVRYSSDFRPISQRNHSQSVSNLENEVTRELLQNYFLKEDGVKDIFLEYETVIHNRIRPYFAEFGMHDLKSHYLGEVNDTGPVLLYPNIIEEQLRQTIFQQLLFERRLKTGAFKTRLTEIKEDNHELISILELNNN